MSLDYWADNTIENRPVTLRDLILIVETGDKYREKIVGDGEFVYKYSSGKIVLRGRYPEGLAYKVTVIPKGLQQGTFEKNDKKLKSLFESSKIKLTRVKE